MATKAPHTQVACAERADEMVRLAIQGMSAPRIARELDVDVSVVRVELFRNARRIRESTADRAAVRFLRHDEILSRLIERWTAALAKGFDRDLAAALIKAMERQARLLGLDVAKTARDLPVDDWIGEQTDAQLVATMRTKYGVNVPHDILSPSRN